MYGIALVAISLIASSRALFAIGLGLFVDELTYLIIKGRTHNDNYSVKSLVGTIFFIVIAYIFRDQLFGFTLLL
jgi:hypothetical protein